MHLRRVPILLIAFWGMRADEAFTQNFWTSTVGPGRGSVNGIAVNQANDVFAATNIGGVQRLLSGTSTWGPVNSGLLDSTVNTVAALPNGTLFIGMNPGGYRSTNNGGTWSSMVELSDYPVLCYGVKSNSELFAGLAFGGALRSVDGGLTWTPTLGNVTVQAIVVSPTSGSVFAATDPGGILRSTTGDPPWITSDSSLNATSLTANALGHIFAGVQFFGVYRTTNNGTTWEQVNTGLPQFTTVRDIIINGTGHVFAATDSGVFRSTDNATTWHPVSSGLTSLRTLSLGMSLDGIAYVGGADGIVRKSTGTTLVPPLPVLIVPADGATNQPTTLTFRWGAANLATLYHLQVSLNSLFTNLALNDSSLVDTSRVVSPLLNATTYHWRVRSGNSNGWSSFSPGRLFTTIVAPPATPVLVSPPNGALNQPTTLLLSWNPSAGATSYRLQVSADSTFSVTFLDDSTITGTSQSVGVLLNATRYFWRVNARNVGGTSPFSLPRNFTTIVAPPQQPTLLFPPNSAVNQPTSLVLSWNTSAGATAYRLQVSDDSTFATMFLDDSTLTGTSRSVGPLQNSTRYYWRVNARNIGGTSAFSSPWNFTTVIAPPLPPTLLSPPNGALNQPTALVFSWNPSSGATSYRLQVSTDSTFATMFLDDSTLTGTSRSVGPLQSSTRYFWRVSAKNAGGTSGFSAAWRFTTIVAPPASPTLVAPANGAVNQPTTVILIWNPSTGATSYRLQVSTDSTFTDMLLDDSTLTGTSRQLEQLPHATTFFWRVNARNIGGSSLFSTAWRFTTFIAPPPQPVLLSPPNGSAGEPVTLSLVWRVAPGAEAYRLQVALDSAFAGMVVDDSTLTDTLYIAGPLFNNTRYFWRVSARNIGGTSAFSTTWSFTTTPIPPPAPPALLSPSDGSIDQPTTLTLRWGSVQGAERYRLQLSLDSTFSTILVDDTTLTGTLRVVGPLANDTRFFWRVGAGNSSGFGSFSVAWSFVTVGIPGVSISPLFLSFGQVTIGRSAEVIAGVRNIGSAPLVIDSIRMRGVNAAEFAVSTTGPFPPIVPSDSVRVPVRFGPQSEGEKSAVMVLYSNANTSPDSLHVFGIGVTAFIQVALTDTPRVGNSLRLSVTIAPGFSPTTRLLFYRNAGDTIYLSTDLIQAGSELQGTIPSSHMNLRGVEYYIFLFDGIGPPHTFPELDPVANPAVIQVVVANAVPPLPFQRLRYRMISVPLDLDSSRNRLVDLLGDDYGTYRRDVWRVFRWQRSAYVEFPDIAARVTPGTAFWLVTHEGRGFDVDTARSVSSAEDYVVAIDSGWNQIASPFAFPIPWSAVRKQGRVKGPYFFDGFQYTLDTTSLLLPWEGYFVYNEEVEPSVLEFPSKRSAGTPPGPGSGTEFTLQLSARLSGGEMRDIHNYLGLHDRADQGNDELDFPKPPSVEENVSLSIVEDGKRFMRNFKSTAGEGQRWTLEVASPIPDQDVVISLHRFGRLPGGFGVYVFDRDDFTIVPTDGDGFVVRTKGAHEARRLFVILGTKEFASGNSGGIPMIPFEYSLEQNFPNPFNPTTMIEYSLKKRSWVVLQVFNILGQHVRTLVNSEQLTGKHLVEWNGLNEAGLPIASGAYIYRLQAGDFVAARKLVLLR